MAVSPSYPNTRYARADVDNVYRWDATAKQWIPTKIASAFGPEITGAPTTGGGGAIAVDPNNPNNVLVVYTFIRSSDVSTTNPNINLKVYYSTDGARTFQASNLNLSGSLSQETVGEHLAIDPNNSNLVEAFFTTKGDVGTGIGLWVTNQLVEAHGGKISVASSIEGVDSGTTVTIFIPFASSSIRGLVRSEVS